MAKRDQTIFDLGFKIWDSGFEIRNPQSATRNPQSHVRGMTLLELMLALALSTLLMLAIGIAIDLHLRALDSRRTSVEEAQLARAVLRNLEKDIRDSVQFETIDFTVVEQLAVGTAINQAASALAGGGGGQDGTGLPGATGQPATGQGGGGQNGTNQGTGTQNNGAQSGGGAGNAGAGGTQGGSTRTTSSTINSSGGRSTTQATSSRASGGATGGAAGATSSGQTGSRSASGISTSGGTASMQSGSRSTMGGTAGVGASGLPVNGAGEQTATESTASEDIAGATGVSSIPGLYGNQYELQIDVSRLPRLDEYSSLMNPAGDGTSAARMPSDVKTVAYYLKTQDDSLAGDSQTTLGGPRTGLVRRELDRAVTSFATANGGSDDLVLAEKVLASEVTSLEFQYYDGQSWLPSWDSDANGGLPVAIEILLGIASSQSRARQRLENGGNPTAYVPAEDDLIYRLVVKLPVGKPASESAATEESTDPAAAEAGTLPGANALPGATGT